MKKMMIALLAMMCLLATVGCNDYETYGDKKDKERNAIKTFIADSNIVVISEEDFHAKGDVTDLAKNEYVYLNNTGVYMQIVSKGCGKPLQDGENTDLIVRFVERCLYDSVGLFNDVSPYDMDLMNIRKSGGSYTASFTEGYMLSSYSASVPSGWLVVFPYINVGRARSADDQISKVRLIVPHTQGHVTATNYVYPYYYEITFQRTIDIL